MSCCDEAATYLIEAFGGEEVMKQTVGGTKWWQVRGIKGCVMCSHPCSYHHADSSPSHGDIPSLSGPGLVWMLNG